MSGKQQLWFIGIGFVLMAVFAPMFAFLTVFAVLQMAFSYFIISHIVKHWRTLAFWYFAAFYIFLAIGLIFSFFNGSSSNSITSLLR